MRQHLNDEKVHYKLYKDGKNWVAASIATGIAIPVALFSAAFLSPVHGVQATSDDPGYTFASASANSWSDLYAKSFKDGHLYDATENDSSTVAVSPDQLQKIIDAGMKLTLKGNQWELAPASQSDKVDFNTVLTGIGFPMAAISAVNNGATDASDIQAILSFVQSHGLETMNGGVTSVTFGGVQNTVLSGSGLDMGSSKKISALTKTIGSTKYSSIVSGPLNKLGDDTGAPEGNTLVADGGTIQGTNVLPNSLTDVVSRFSFTDGSFAQAMVSLRDAVEKINSYLGTVTTDVPAQTVAANGDNQVGFVDFSKAKRDSNGDYVFTLDSDKFTPAGMNTIDFLHKEEYQGGNVILYVTGKSSLDFTGQARTFTTNSSFIQNGQLFISVPNGNDLVFGGAGSDRSGVNLLAPTSTYISQEVFANGLVGVINGDSNPSTPIDAGGNGYINPGDGSDTLTPTDDPGNDPTKPTDTTKTPDAGGDTTTTTPTTPKSKAVTVNQTISTSISNKGGIDPTDIPESDLPKNIETKSTTFTATVKDDGTVSYTNADGSITLDAPFDDVPVETTTKIGNTTYTVQVTGTLKCNSGLDEDTLDTKAVTDQIGQATDGTTLNWNISVVYFPSSTSKHKQVTFNNEVFFDYADNDYDSDPANLPQDFTRTAVVSYVETTDSQGHSSYSDWQVEQSLDALTDANVPTMTGYRTNIENDITDEAILGMLKAMGPINGASVTAETQVMYWKASQLDDGVQVRTIVPTDAPSVSIGDYYDHTKAGNTGDGIHVYENDQQPAGVEEPQGTVGTNTDTGEINPDDPDHVYEKDTQPGGVEEPQGTVGTNTDTGEINPDDPDHVYEKDTQPGGVEEPQGTVGTNTDTGEINPDDPDHVYTKAQQPAGVEEPQGTVGTNTDTGEINPDDPDHVYEKDTQPGGVEEPQGTVGTNTDTGEINPDDPDHVYEKDTQPGGVEEPQGTVGTNTDTGEINPDDPDHVYEKDTQPGGVEEPQGIVGTNTDTGEINPDDPDHVYEKDTQPGGVEEPQGTVGTNTDTGEINPDDPDHVYEKNTQPGGVTDDGQTTTTTPSGDDGQTTTTTIPSDDGQTTATTTTPSGDDGQTTTTTTPGGDDGQTTTTTTPSGDDGQTTTTTTTPSGDDGQTTTTTTPSGDDGQTTTTTTPSGDDGQTTTTTTPSGDDSQTTTTTTPSGDDGQTTTTTTPSGDDGQTTTTTTPSGDAGQTTTTTTPSGDDGQTTTTTTPSGDDGQTTTTTTPSGDDGQTTTTTTPSGDDGQTTTTTTPSGDDGQTTTTTTPSGDDGQTTTTTTPSGDDGQTTTTTTPSGDDGQTTTTTTPSGDAGQTTTTTTPSGDDGQTTTTTPSGDDGQATTTTPSGDDGQTTTTTTPSGDAGQTTTTTTTPSDGNGQTTTTTTPSGNNGSLTTNVGTPANTAATTPNASVTTPQANSAQARTGNGLAGQTPATSTTTVNPDGTTSRTSTYVDATQAPVATTAQAGQTQAPAANADTQTVDANKAGIPDQTATIADQTNTPAAESPAESVTTVANVIDENAQLTHGNIFTAGGAPGMADYTFFSQPVMDSSTNSVDHYELLLRVWDSKQGGWHLPASFSIPASMEAHLMARAVAQLDVKDISINLTDAQFEDPDTQKAITDLAQSDAVDSLTVELATIPDSEELATNAKVFQAAGVKVTLHNLGSHTDGTQLANAADHVDTLKVSLRGMRRDGNNLTQMTNQLAAWQKAAAVHDDSLEVEGLETPEDLAMTNDLGITAVQGYYFSRPAMPGTRADLM